MARLDITIEHGQNPEVARAEFRAAVLDVRTRFPRWIERLDLSEDVHAATLAGAGFEVRCWYDERYLHVQGSIPLVWKFLEGAIRHQIKRTIDRARITHHP